MFKKLRNKFLIINAAAIIAVVIVSFIAILLITSNNVQNEVNEQLQKTLTEKFNKPFNEEIQRKDEIVPKDDKFSPPSISFSILLDKNKNIDVINNPHFNNITDNIAEDLLDVALKENKNKNFFKYDDSYWAYEIVKTNDEYNIAFVDITNNISILLNFIYAFLAVSFFSLIIIFIFSRYFANKAIQPIQEAFDKQKDFISDASHELKTPLTIINTNIDYILSNKNESVESQEKWLNYIKSEGVRMSKLTNDLLYLAKVDNFEKSTIHNSFNLSETIENSILPMEAIIFEKDLKLNYDIEENIFINGNSQQIKQVAIILLDNAIRYSNENGVISVELKKNHKDIIFSVKNTGIAIEKENLDKVFDRFYRTDESRNRQTGGHGLGLAIAKSIIDEHNGVIKASSIKDDSTTFTITFPCN